MAQILTADELSAVQKQVDDMQQIYREWLALQVKLQQAEQDLQQSIQLMNTLEQFYFNGDFMHYLSEMEQGLDLDLTTEGEYSVLAEDTIWNALHEQQMQLWRILRMVTGALDPEKQNQNVESVRDDLTY